MKKTCNLLILLSLFGLLLLPSCKQPEGYGGTSHIRGTIQVHYYDTSFSVLLFEQAAQDEDVFLSFGESNIVDDDVETSYSGEFAFEYLFPGNYKIYYYSLDPNAHHLEKVEFIIPVELKRGEDLDLGELILYKTKDWDEGYAIIKGQVLEINYRSESVYPNHMLIKDTTYAQEAVVYIVHGNNLTYDDRIRTQHDGRFAFPNLIKGNYLVYLYSEDLSGSIQDICLEFPVSILEETEIIDLGIIYIDNI